MIILRNKEVMYSDLEEREFVFNPHGWSHYNERTGQMVQYQPNGKVQTRPATMQERMGYRQRQKELAVQERARRQNMMKSAAPSSQMVTGMTKKPTGILSMARKNTGIISMAKKRL